MLEDRLMTSEFEIDRRDAIAAKNRAVERNLEERRQQREEQQQDIGEGHRARPEAVATRSSIAKAVSRQENDLMVNVLSRTTTDPNLENWYVPMDRPPRPPPPKQSSVDAQRDMEQAKAIAKAKNASQDTGWASNLVEAVVRAKDAMKAAGETSQPIEVNFRFHGPKPTMKPPPTVTPKKPPPAFFEPPYRSEDEESTGLRVMSPSTPEDRTSVLSAAAREAAAVIAQAKEEVFPSIPKAKPGPKGFEWVPTDGKTPSSCRVLKAILDQNGDDPLPPPPAFKPPPLRLTEAERTAIAAADERQLQRDRTMSAPSREAIQRNAKQALEQAKARQQKQPPLKGSSEHKRALLKTSPPAKPAPGFPQGTAIPRGFVVKDSGKIMYQPALLPDNMLLGQTEAARLAMESLPPNVMAHQMVAPNEQVMIALTNPTDTSTELITRWNQPSAVTSRWKCAICGEGDKEDRPLHTCWHEDHADGKKCGRRFCYNSHKKCGSRVAFNVKPPSPSGLKDFPDCLWCKKHDGVLLPVSRFKLKTVVREDWYHWDPEEAFARALKFGEVGSEMTRSGWRINHASQGFKNY
eukprot:5675-Amphidinium_carterae.1